MKSILIIVSDITKLGGTERAVINLANLLISKNKICVVSLYKSVLKHPSYSVHEKVKIEYLDIVYPENSFERLIQYIMLIFVMRKFNKARKFDFIISTRHTFSCLLPLIVMFCKTSTIAAEHIARSSLPFFSKLLQRITYSHINAIVVLSPTARNNYIFCNNLFVIPNSLPFPPTRHSQQNNKIIIAVGRISVEKGLDRLIEIAVHLKDQMSGWKIKVFGNGPFEDEFKRLIDDLKLNDFLSLNDAVSNIQAEYLSSDILIMTSRYEAFPMVLLEAKACGVPVVAYNCPEGPQEIINDGFDGFLIEDGNAKAMTEKLKLLMYDDTLRKTFGKNAIASIAEYNDEVIAKKWSAVFDSLI